MSHWENIGQFLLRPCIKMFNVHLIISNDEYYLLSSHSQAEAST